MNSIRLLALLVTFLIFAPRAQACSLYPCELDLVADFRRAHHVFFGRVVKVEQVARVINKGDLVDVYFDIKKTWKGSLNNRPLRAINTDPMCFGTFFQEGEIRLYFLDKRGDEVGCYQYQVKNEKQLADITAYLDRLLLNWETQ